MSPRYRMRTTKFGCDGVDDFMKFSKRKFGNLISPDERDAVV